MNTQMRLVSMVFTAGPDSPGTHDSPSTSSALESSKFVKLGGIKSARSIGSRGTDAIRKHYTTPTRNRGHQMKCHHECHRSHESPRTTTVIYPLEGEFGSSLRVPKGVWHSRVHHHPLQRASNKRCSQFSLGEPHATAQNSTVRRRDMPAIR